MSQAIKLVGLDCGSTTTSAVVATARLATGALGRVEITGLEQVFRSPIVFTPFDGDKIDAARLERYLDEWLDRSATRPDDVCGGGALVTGLAARRENAAAIALLVEARLADAVIATANDPCLESWLAFMGNCHALSRKHPTTPIMNLDVGGGTTNLALGLDGQVRATGCLFVGARHFEFAPGTFQLRRMSHFAVELLASLGFERRTGETLTRDQIDAILDFYLELIEATIEGRTDRLASEIAQQHVQVPLQPASALVPGAAITLSGGVGQLVYDLLAGRPTGGTTQFGDLGGELAERIVRSPAIRESLSALVPEGLGRATVFGLMRHSMELSGSTLHLPHAEGLPLKNVPIIGRVGPTTSDEQLAVLLTLAARGTAAACLQVEPFEPNLEAVRRLGDRLADVLTAIGFPRDRTLVLLVPDNSGKVLGGYATRWGTLPIELIVVDEVPWRDAQFVRLGKPRAGVVPVWLHAVQ